jgi:hypothetical protein
VDRNQIIEEALSSSIFTKWHWFAYHFQFYLMGGEHPFAGSIIDACLEIETKKAGCGLNFLNRIASISGKEKHLPHYEQLLQILAELLIIKQIVNYSWPQTTVFEFEPSVGESKKNPELIIEFDTNHIGIEVKAPSLLAHQNTRHKNDIQLPSRSIMMDAVKSENVTLPRDNPVKDFLISSDAKFAEFKKANPAFYSVLVIVWDDHIFEPISSLTAEFSGLFTSNSFYKDENDKPIVFKNIDAVIIVRHLHQFEYASADRPLYDGKKHILDYGEYDGFPPKVIIPNPYVETYWSDAVHDNIKKCFNVYLPDSQMGAEYSEAYYIHWL